MKCVCGHEGEDFIIFKAVVWRVSTGSFTDRYFPEQGVNLAACPECGTLRCNIRESDSFKYVEHANFSNPSTDETVTCGWGRKNNSPV